jgi:hypothetical protein
VLLAEDLLILLTKRMNVDPPRRGGTQAVLAAALLLELAKNGRLGVDWDGARRLHVFVAVADGEWPADETTKAIADDCANIVRHWTSGSGGTTATTPT